ncbi:MAG: hypothetical protein WKF58_15685 [Ilumatobacteraceae bacterium]
MTAALAREISLFGLDGAAAVERVVGDERLFRFPGLGTVVNLHCSARRRGSHRRRSRPASSAWSARTAAQAEIADAGRCSRPPCVTP